MTPEQRAREIVAVEVDWITMCGFKFQWHSVQAMEARIAAALREERARALEEAAKICDLNANKSNVALDDDDTDDEVRCCYQSCVNEAMDIRDAIRALAPLASPQAKQQKEGGA